MTPTYDVAIIGAGAAGLAAAIFAGEHAGGARRIILIDGARKPGAKILVSGGGRCNVTNERVTPDDYCGGSRNIIRNVLRTYDEHRVRDWMASLGVELKLEPTGKYFPVTDSARTVLDALMARVDELGVEKLFGFRVADVRRADDPDDPAPWRITQAGPGNVISARRIIVAAGGRALPKSGSDGAAYAWLQRLGHSIVTPVPALAPLVLDERGADGSPISRHFADLAGITLDTRLAFGDAVMTGSTLFTHFGLSGPAPMNISRHLARHRDKHNHTAPLTITMNLAPGFAGWADVDAWLLKTIDKNPRAGVITTLARLVPERIAIMLASRVAAERLSDLNRDSRHELARLVAESPLSVKGDRGFAFAETTAGGVTLSEINWRSMESRKAPGLYLCGEVLDVDGRIGGFNFQWAWASGHIAGRAVADD